jgi:proteasome lid subunit RPN8/RPN11
MSENHPLLALVDDVMQHASKTAPQECCGLAVRKDGVLIYWPARNIATGNDAFEIAPEDWAAAEDTGEIVGVCHAHMYLPPVPSMADRVSAARSGLPWLIVGYPTGDAQVLAPDPYDPPLIGRPFVHGVLDCFSLIRDYYRMELGIALPDFARSDEWWLKGGDLYRQHFAEAGFVQVAGSEFDMRDLREHDVLLMQVASPVLNHGAVYLGGQVILHHCQNQLSGRSVYGGFWRRATGLVVRHRSLLENQQP